jgi:hypothetical protein
VWRRYVTHVASVASAAKCQKIFCRGYATRENFAARVHSVKYILTYVSNNALGVYNTHHLSAIIALRTLSKFITRLVSNHCYLKPSHGLGILSCEEALKLAYRTCVVLLMFRSCKEGHQRPFSTSLKHSPNNIFN